MDSIVSEILSRTGSLPPGTVIAVVGATGVGKSSVADELAARIDAEIVSADSMQIYRCMDIGTAKVPASKRSVPYRCIDLVDPGEPYSASLYQRDARAAIEDIHARGKRAIVCGGTGLYVRAALDAMEFPAGEQVGNAVRDRYQAILEEEGPERVHALLAEVDPASAAIIHPNNSRRVIRALEMHEEGTSYAEQAAGMKTFTPFYDAVYIGLAMEREPLYEAINRRVDKMMEEGLLDEVRSLLARGFKDAITSSQAIGYKEFIPVIEEGAPLDEAVESVKRATRRYAKRQHTWFNRDPRIEWLPAAK